jgi:hypothetical protein
MEQEFKAIIEKNLPAQVGDVLKKKLEQADKDAADLMADAALTVVKTISGVNEYFEENDLIK